MYTALVAGFVVLGSTSAAFADCASPASPEGGLNYVDAATGFQYCDGTNWLDLGSSGSSLWTDNTTHISRSNFHILNTGLAAGSTTAGLDGNGIYAFYDPDKGVMRGGTISGGDDAWQDAVIGGNSFAWGLNAEAQGGNSVAFGQFPVATGGGSVAMGIIPQALTYASVAIGYNVVSSGNTAMGIGSEMNLTGADSRAFGSYLTTSGDNSLALGYEATVTGQYSVAIGAGDSSAWPPPIVSGNNSFGIFMGDQTGIDLTDANTFSFMGASGGVGIGTVAPEALLDIYGATTQLRVGSDASSYLEFLSNGNTLIAHNGGGNLYVRPDYDSEMIIDSGGGTWAPSANESFLTISTANTTADAPAAGGISALKITGGYEATSARTYTGSLTGIDLTYTFGNGANTTYNAATPITGLSISPTINVNTASTRGYSAIFTNVTETSVSASGNNRLLDLRTNGYDTFAVASNGTVKIDNDGNAGSNGCIRYDGTNSKLQYSHDCTTYVDMGGAGGSTAINDLTDAYTDYTTDHNMRIGSDTAMFSGAANNLFIGELAGTAGTSNAADNNVGIGYQSLNSNTTGNDNIALGPYALNSNTTGGSSIAIGTSALGNAVSQMNIAIGNSALYNTTGIDNIAMGFYSLINNSTGSNNIAFGNFALDSNTTGSSNVAFRSLENNTTGDANIAIGQNSLGTNVANSESTAVGYNSMRYANDTATGVITYNTAVGAYALQGSTTASDNTGTNNTAIGHSALLANTEGSENVAVGSQALTSSNNAVAGNNVAVGSGAMHDALTSYNNVAIGQGAMSQAGTGYDNVAIGRFAGIEMEGNSNVAVGTAALIYGYGTTNSVAVGRAALSTATGDNNIALGHQAGDNITTGASNIMIGYDIDAPSATGNNQLVIGNTIYGDLSTDQIAIGTATQTTGAQFKVAGTSSIMIPSGTDAQRPATGAAGMVRYNSTATPNDKVEYYDAESAAWVQLAGGSGGSSVFEVASNVVRGVSGTVAYATDDFVFGSPQLADDTDATHDNRFWFDKSKGAFRAGGVTGAQWDDANVGDYSFAGGYNTEAGGYYAFAFGTGSDAAGYYSIAMGENNYAGATAAIVMGANSTASGSASVAIGSDSTASGDYSRAIGAYTIAAGDYSVAMGREVNISATGDGSMGIGLTTTSPATDPIISGAQSFGIFMGDQSGIDLTQANTMSLMGGRLGIGTVTPSVELEVTGDIEYTGTITDVSDMRLKDNIAPLIKTGSLLERIDQIDTYSFSMKNDKAKRTEFGVMAQELEKIFPELVHTAKDEMGTKSVNYVGLIAPMIEATKELRAENKEMKAALNDLNEQVALLNKIAGNKVSKASTENIWMLMFGLLCGIGGMLVLQRKNHNK